MMNILITGGSGFIGAALRDRLHYIGHHVRVVDLVRDFDGPPLTWTSSSAACGVEFIHGDIRSSEVMERACDGMDVVMHCAAEVPILGSGRRCRSVNVDGTRTVVEAAKAAGVQQFIYLSSSAVYGAPDVLPVSEQHPIPCPAELYGRSKLDGEHIVRESGISNVTLRPRTVLGPGRAGIFSILFERVWQGKWVPIIKDTLVQFLHVNDLVDACVLALREPSTGMVYNLGGATTRMRWLLCQLCDHAHSTSQIVSVPQPVATLIMRSARLVRLAPFAPYHWLMYGRSMWLDTTLAQQYLGWTPQWTTAQALTQAYDWYVEHRTRGHAVSPHRMQASL